MGEVEFNNEAWKQAYRPATYTGIIGWIIRKGWVRDGRAANKLLVGVIVLAVLASLIAVRLGGANNEPPPKPLPAVL